MTKHAAPDPRCSLPVPLRNLAEQAAVSQYGEGFALIPMETAVKKLMMVTTLVFVSAGLAGCADPYYSYNPPSYAYVAPAPAPYYYDSYGHTYADRENLARWGHTYPRF